MRFTSFIYIIFLAAVAGVLWLLPARFRKAWLLFASYVFYASWGVSFLAILVGSAVLNYAGAHWIARSSTRTRRGGMVIAANVALLASFKYLDWLSSLGNQLASLVGLPPRLPLPHWPLPLGISFYLFESISYVTDVMRRRERPRGFVDVQLFIAFFPKLIAGPILRAREFFPQLVAARPPDAAAIQYAVRQLVTGLFMKVFLVDRAGGGLAVSVDQAFAQPLSTLTSADVWLMSLAFSLQLYFDFSAYTRIALGSAKLCGIALVDNFDHPFVSTSPAEFWRRWHISLSRWVRDYVFVPLQGDHAGPLATAYAAFVSMVLFGVWHGAGWHFVLWGAYNGCILVGYQMLAPLTARVWARAGRNSGATLVRGFFGWMVTIGLFTVGAPIWRCADVAQGLGLVRRAVEPWAYPGMTVPRVFAARALEIAAVVVALGIAHILTGRRARVVTASPSGPSFAFRGTVEGIALGLLVIVTLVHLEGQRTFVYFAF